MLVRDCECLRCKYRWPAEVVYSKFTHNLSGEATHWCPMCGTREVKASPHRPAKWWLLNEVTLDKVRALAAELSITGRGTDCEKLLVDLYHELDSGAHSAGDLVPTDYMLKKGEG